jgi:hypothetical protein
LLEFAQRLFGELNRNILGPPDDGNIIVLSDSDKEEVCEEKTTDIETMAASAAVNPASTTSVDAPAGVKDDNSDDQRTDQEAGGDNDSGDGTGEPSAAVPRRCRGRRASRRTHWFCIVVPPSLCIEKLR